MIRRRWKGDPFDLPTPWRVRVRLWAAQHLRRKANATCNACYYRGVRTRRGKWCPSCYDDGEGGELIRDPRLRVMQLGRWTVRDVTRAPGAPCGPFGGGWHRQLGVQLGKRTRTGAQDVILNAWTRQYRAQREGRPR